jgi:hypothetical protein
MEQRSEEWFEARLGVVTASTFKVAFSGGADARRGLAMDTAAEILTGSWQETSAASLVWGREYEEQAIGEYEFMTDAEVERVGLIYHPDSALVGASPDGLVGEQGGIEVKCPASPREHLTNLLNGMSWSEHGPQVQGALWVTDRRWWDFVSFDPRFPAPQRIYIERVYRDEGYISRLAEAVWGVVEEAQSIVERVTGAPVTVEEPTPDARGIF